MPITESLLHRKWIKEEVVNEAIVQKRKKQKLYYDNHAQQLGKLDINKAVMFRKSLDAWEFGTVMDNVNDRSYLIKDSQGKFFRSNRKLFTKCNVDVECKYLDCDEDEDNDVDYVEDNGNREIRQTV